MSYSHMTFAPAAAQRHERVNQARSSPSVMHQHVFLCIAHLLTHETALAFCTTKYKLRMYTCCIPPMTGALDMPMASQGALLMSPLKYCPICKRAFVGSGAVCVTFCRFGCCPAAHGISNMQCCPEMHACCSASARFRVYTWCNALHHTT